MLRVWSVLDGQSRSVMRGHFNPVRALEYSQNGDRVVSVSDDQSLRLWEPETGLEALRLIVSDQAVTSLAVLADGQAIAVAGADGTVRVFDAAEVGTASTDRSPVGNPQTPDDTKSPTTAESRIP